MHNFDMADWLMIVLAVAMLAVALLGGCSPSLKDDIARDLYERLDRQAGGESS